MALKIEVTEIIDRPVKEVFQFFAIDHVLNHPRWDPTMNLEQITESPMSTGTIIHRRYNRSGVQIEGTMEVVEFEKNKVFSTIIRDGDTEMLGVVKFEESHSDQTRLNLFLQIEDMDESMANILTDQIKMSYEKIKQLIETETDG